MAKLVIAGKQRRTCSADEKRDPHTLLISVAHGDLRLAKYPLAVGHYNGDTIVHAEKRLDDQLRGRLTELFNMYLYPGPKDTAEVIHVPEATPPGALIIGLGDVGEIDPSLVRNGISNAALRHALARLNEARNSNSAAAGWVSAGFSTLLLGTYGGNALSIEASLSAIVQGAIRANEALRSQGLFEKVRIDEVQFVELYEDVALEAARAATYLTKHPPLNLGESDSLKVEPPYIHPLGNGRFQRPVDPYTRGWWRRIRITCEKLEDGSEGLRFLALTDRARAEDTLQYTQREFIEDLVQRTVNSSVKADEFATVLFKLLIPNSLKDQTRSDGDLVLVLDAAAAQYPWELLAERTREGVQPFAIRMGLIRQFQTGNFIMNPQPARERTALVIGEPKSDQLPLPGARDEATAVAKVLGQEGYDVGDGALLGGGALEILNRLFARGYKILHLAGHGQYVKGKPGESGMILDNGRCLSSITMRNLSPLPELVFINCCHLGKLDNSEQLQTTTPHILAASISEELINMGVKAVVAAGWAVEDKAAAAFAETFYSEMLRGQKFGMAVKSARIKAHQVSSSSNTWGAYQCYGNPDFVLERGGDSSESSRPRENICYSQREYLERLGDIESDAVRSDAGARAKLAVQIEELDAALPAIWRDGAVLCAFGAAWKALGEYKRAIDCYREAESEEKAAAPLSTIEQLANLLVVYADRLRAAGAGTADADDPADLINDAIKRLRWLLQLSKSSERLSLMAGCYKRKALAASTWHEKARWLKVAAGFYREAHIFYKDRTGSVNPYPALNWLTYSFLLGEPLDGEIGIIDESITAAMKAEMIKPEVWNRVTEPDAEVLRHLIQGDLDSQAAKIVLLYRRAFGAGVTQRQLAAVVSQFDFLIGMLSASGKNVDALTRLSQELQRTLT